MLLVSAIMEMFAWLEAPISMRVEWRCALMICGGLCVMTYGTTLMQQWSANSWDTCTLEVCIYKFNLILCNITRFLYATGGTAYINAHFGAGSGPIVLDDVQCTSSDSKLVECYSRPILSHNCLHSADAGVGCKGKRFQA